MVGKEDKAGVTVMISSTAAGTMIPLQAITSGTTQAALGKFVDSNKGYNEEGGGYKEKPTHKRRKTIGRDGQLAKHPPYYRDAATGNIICAGALRPLARPCVTSLWLPHSTLLVPASMAECVMTRSRCRAQNTLDERVYAAAVGGRSGVAGARARM